MAETCLQQSGTSTVWFWEIRLKKLQPLAVFLGPITIHWGERGGCGRLEFILCLPNISVKMQSCIFCFSSFIYSGTWASAHLSQTLHRLSYQLICFLWVPPKMVIWNTFIQSGRHFHWHVRFAHALFIPGLNELYSFFHTVYIAAKSMGIYMYIMQHLYVF